MFDRDVSTPLDLHFFLLGMGVGIGTISESKVTFCRKNVPRLFEWNENESSFDIIQP